MGRKKIQITRIMDERNRQVSHTDQKEPKTTSRQLPSQKFNGLFQTKIDQVGGVCTLIVGVLACRHLSLMAVEYYCSRGRVGGEHNHAEMAMVEWCHML